MRPRILGAVVVVVVALQPGAAHWAAAQPLPARPAATTDPQLRQAVGHALARRVEGRREPLISVEALTSDNAAVQEAVNRLGGTVTGSVAGQLVEALVPAGSVEALSLSGTARYMQSPLRVNRLPPTESVGFGPTVGNEVTLTNAAAWHTAGMTGNVRVGIIDFFDLGFWNTTEHDAVPDAAHQFCPNRTEGLCTPTGQIDSAGGDRHGVAVAEIVKDMAPGSELFLATTASTAETQAAIDWFAANGVHILTRSLGAPYDGPGNGTGPLDAVVDYAAARGITWFNSGGNDAASGYGRYTGGVDAGGYVDFDNGPGVDTVLRIDPSLGGVAFDGIRWANDWYLPVGSVTDYSVEVSVGTSEFSRTPLVTLDNSQTDGAAPLEAVDDNFAVGSGQFLFIRIHADVHYSPSAPDTVEVATFFGAIEAGRQSASFSAAKPVVDSANPALLAVGAVDPANGSTIASYSSQGPTNDGRIKPDISAPSCVGSTVYLFCFNGTSAASPAAAGVAALLLGQGLALPGMPLAALTRHLTRDLGPAGPDNAYGAGEILLPNAPVPSASATSKFSSLDAPVRLLDTRPMSFVGPANLIGPYPPYSIVDLPITPSGVIPPSATAVAVNITSTDSVLPFFVQALPTLGGGIGAFSTTNVTVPGHTQPNFAIVPLGQGSISIFIPTGGNIIVDAMGFFTPSGETRGGRYVPVDPRRVLDTRPTEPGPVPAGWSAHQPAAGETVRVDVPADAGVPPTGVAALVVNVTATEPVGPGFLQVLPTGAVPGQTSNVNYAADETTATLAVVPVGVGGTISVYTYNSAHIVVDVMGYITDDNSDSSGVGLFVPVPPNRYYDSRSAPNSMHAGMSTVTVQLASAPPLVPVGASAISMNLTSDQAVGAGYLAVYPADGPFPLASNLNFVAGTTVANAGLVKLSAGGALNTFVNVATHIIIDVNGYFTGTQ